MYIYKGFNVIKNCIPVDANVFKQHRVSCTRLCFIYLFVRPFNACEQIVFFLYFSLPHNRIFFVPYFQTTFSLNFKKQFFLLHDLLFHLCLNYTSTTTMHMNLTYGQSDSIFQLL